MSNNSILGDNKLTNPNAPNWKRPSNLTQSQNEILDNLNFPKSVDYPNVLQKKITQSKNGAYYENNGIDENSTVYTTIPYNAAKAANPHVSQGNMSNEAYATAKAEKVKEYQNKPVIDFFYDRSNIENEMQNVLQALDAPTVSETVANPPTKATVQKEGERTETTNLSTVQKNKIKGLLEDGYSTGEIAEEINKPEHLVIDYVNKLKK